jgi:hypothetical protein
LACRDLNIPALEVQHGLQGDSHLSYAKWTKVPKYGYKLIPNYFLVWSETEATTINSWSSSLDDIHKPIPIGNIYLQKWVDGKLDFINSFDEEVQRFLGRSYSYSVLYSISHKLPPAHVMEIIKGNPEVLFFIRLHPSRLFMRSTVEEYCSDWGVRNFELEFATAAPLYAILRNVKFHISRYSSVVLEAQHFGVPSLIVDQMGIDLFKSEIAKGVAFSALTADAISSAMVQQYDGLRMSKSKNDRVDIVNFIKEIWFQK